MLLLINWIVLLGQTGEPVKCYTQSELTKIANKMVFAQEADSLRKVAEKQVQFLSDQVYALKYALVAKQKEVDTEKSIVVLTEDIITGKDGEIGGLRKALKKEGNKLKWTRIGWISTSAILTTIILTR